MDIQAQAPATEIMLRDGKTDLLDANLSVLEPFDARQDEDEDEEGTKKILFSELSDINDCRRCSL